MRHVCRRLVALAAGLVTGASAAVALAQDAPDTPDVGKLVGLVRPSGVVFSLIVFVAAIVSLRFVTNVADRLGLQFANRRPLIQKVESFTRFAIYFVTASIVIVLSFRFDEETLKIIGGALAFAVGFAMRDLVAAIIAGVMIMFDRPFQVGDRVMYAGEYGDILQIVGPYQ